MKRLALLALAAAAAPAAAQRIPESAVTLGVERIFADLGDDGFSVLMLRHSNLDPGDEGAGLEFGFAFLPGGMPFMPVGLEFGPVFTAGSLPLLHFRAGVSLVMLVIPGVYVGGGLTVPITDGVGIRFDGTYRIYLAGHEHVGVSSFGAGLSFFTGGRRAAAEPPRCNCDGEERP